MKNSQPFSMEARQLTNLMKVSLTLNSTLNLDDLLQYIIKTAIEVLDCEAASLLLYDEKRNQLFFAAASNADVRQMSGVPLDTSLAGSIFREGKSINISDVRGDPRHFTPVSQQLNFEARSLLGVPMRIRDKGVGVLEALNHREGTFSQADERLLSVLASQAAVAIQNARLVQALEKANAEVIETDRLKTSFLALASHELRTPLGIIIGYATFLQDENEGEVNEQAERVLEAAGRMRSVIEAMTSLQRLQAMSLTLKPRVVPIQQVLSAAYEEMRPLAEEMRHTVSFDMPEHSLLVRADPEKLTPAFVNIINNAIRFTPKGGSLTIGAAEKSGSVGVWIGDNGIGLAPEQLSKIFQEFYQVESGTTRHFGGLGIGLTIAKGLIETQAGRIWAESEGLGRGTLIKVLMPAAGTASLSTPAAQPKK
jgi:signal transduction histidine kinase